MKRLFFFLALFSSQLFFGQDVEAPSVSNEKDNYLYALAGIEVKPEFPGGISEFYKYVANNYKKPKSDLHGKVFVIFVIEKDGSLTDIKVLRDIGFGTGEEAIRVMKECPKWIPGEQNGRKVRVQYALPISL
jgi:protein TonB